MISTSIVVFSSINSASSSHSSRFFLQICRYVTHDKFVTNYDRRTMTASKMEMAIPQVPLRAPATNGTCMISAALFARLRASMVVCKRE
jgi:hypothetical protein